MCSYFIHFNNCGSAIFWNLGKGMAYKEEPRDGSLKFFIFPFSSSSSISVTSHCCLLIGPFLRTHIVFIQLKRWVELQTLLYDVCEAKLVTVLTVPRWCTSQESHAISTHKSYLTNFIFSGRRKVVWYHMECNFSFLFVIHFVCIFIIYTVNVYKICISRFFLKRKSYCWTCIRCWAWAVKAQILKKHLRSVGNGILYFSF